MSNTGRRTWGSMIEPKKVGLWLEGPANRRLVAMAKAAGTTKSAMSQWLIEQMELDADGVPLGWAEDHPRLEGELPLADSA